MEPPPSKRARVSLEPIPAAKITSIDVQGNMVLEPFVFDDLRHNTIFWWRSGPLLTTTYKSWFSRFIAHGIKLTNVSFFASAQ
jgi:hypothetical protein